MSQIRRDAPPSLADALKEARRGDQYVAELLKEVKQDRANAALLTKLDMQALEPAAQREVSQLLLEQLRGQLPPKVVKALSEGSAEPGMLGQLASRLANSLSGEQASRFGVAISPEAARAAAAEGSIPQQALAWAQFVQKATHVPGSGVQSRSGSASPKGTGTILAELLGKKITQGPGLRTPKLVERSMNDLSPAQRAILLKATFGDKLAQQLADLGITDPLLFVKAGAHPGDRAQLADSLGLSRAELLTLLMRAELLKIGPGRNGELGIRPDLLAALHAAGIAGLGSLAALRGLSREELAAIYRRLRDAAGGFAKAVGGGRVPVKRDLLHWARTAARGKSDLLLADYEQLERGGAQARGDAQELIHAWYLENLLWWELADARQRALRDERERKRRDGGQGEEPEEQESDELAPEMEHDASRDDRLVCFWITDYNIGSSAPGAARRMYVCIDPESGAIIPQFIEQDSLGPLAKT